MTTPRFSRQGTARRGFTLIELLVGMVLGAIVMTGVVQMMIVQSRGYRKQREMIDVRETAREAVAMLSWDLRQSVTGGSPLAAMGPGMVALRSPRGLGTICAKHATLARYGRWQHCRWSRRQRPGLPVGSRQMDRPEDHCCGDPCSNGCHRLRLARCPPARRGR